MCDVTCKVGIPCEYKDEVDVRIIIMTFDRHHSLSTCREAISDVDTMGRRNAAGRSQPDTVYHHNRKREGQLGKEQLEQ